MATRDNLAATRNSQEMIMREILKRTAGTNYNHNQNIGRHTGDEATSEYEDFRSTAQPLLNRMSLPTGALSALAMPETRGLVTRSIGRIGGSGGEKISHAINSHPHVTQMLGSAFIPTMALSESLKAKKLAHERQYADQMGKAGKASRVLSTIGTMNYMGAYLPRALKQVTTGNMNIPFTNHAIPRVENALAPIGNAIYGGAKHMAGGVANMISPGAAGKIGGSAVGSALDKGLSSIVGSPMGLTLALAGAQIGLSFMKAAKMAKLLPTKKGMGVDDRKYSMTSQNPQLIQRIVNMKADPNILNFLMMQLVESNTRYTEMHLGTMKHYLREIFSEMDFSSQKHEKGATLTESSYSRHILGDDDRTKFDKSLDWMEEKLAHIKNTYDPVTQIMNMIVGGMTGKWVGPKQTKEGIGAVYGEKSEKTFLKLREKKFGMNIEQVRLIHTSSRAVMGMGVDFETKSLSLQAGQYDLQRIIASELVTIRRNGFDIKDSVIHAKSRGWQFKFGEMLTKGIRSIPGVGALFNIAAGGVNILNKGASGIIQGITHGIPNLFKKFNNFRKGISNEKHPDDKKTAQGALVSDLTTHSLLEHIIKETEKSDLVNAHFLEKILETSHILTYESIKYFELAKESIEFHKQPPHYSKGGIPEIGKLAIAGESQSESFVSKHNYLGKGNTTTNFSNFTMGTIPTRSEIIPTEPTKIFKHGEPIPVKDEQSFSLLKKLGNKIEGLFNITKDLTKTFFSKRIHGVTETMKDALDKANKKRKSIISTLTVKTTPKKEDDKKEKKTIEDRIGDFLKWGVIGGLIGLAITKIKDLLDKYTIDDKVVKNVIDGILDTIAKNPFTSAGAVLGGAAGAFFGPTGFIIGALVGGAFGALVDYFKKPLKDEIDKYDFKKKLGEMWDKAGGAELIVGGSMVGGAVGGLFGGPIGGVVGAVAGGALGMLVCHLKNEVKASKEQGAMAYVKQLFSDIWTQTSDVGLGAIGTGTGAFIGGAIGLMTGDPLFGIAGALIGGSIGLVVASLRDSIETGKKEGMTKGINDFFFGTESTSPMEQIKLINTWMFLGAGAGALMGAGVLSVPGAIGGALVGGGIGLIIALFKNEQEKTKLVTGKNFNTSIIEKMSEPGTYSREWGEYFGKDSITGAIFGCIMGQLEDAFASAFSNFSWMKTIQNKLHEYSPTLFSSSEDSITKGNLYNATENNYNLPMSSAHSAPKNIQDNSYQLYSHGSPTYNSTKYSPVTPVEKTTVTPTTLYPDAVSHGSPAYNSTKYSSVPTTSQSQVADIVTPSTTPATPFQSSSYGNVTELLKPLIRKNEGLAYAAYNDGAYNSIGFGHNSKDIPNDSTITGSQAEAYLTQDIIAHTNAASKVFKGYDQLSPVRQAALADLTYQYGPGNEKTPGVKIFKDVEQLMVEGKYNEAADALLKKRTEYTRDGERHEGTFSSLFGQRAKILASMIKDDKMPSVGSYSVVGVKGVSFPANTPAPATLEDAKNKIGGTESSSSISASLGLEVSSAATDKKKDNDKEDKSIMGMLKRFGTMLMDGGEYTDRDGKIAKVEGLSALFNGVLSEAMSMDVAEAKKSSSPNTSKEIIGTLDTKQTEAKPYNLSNTLGSFDASSMKADIDSATVDRKVKQEDEFSNKFDKLSNIFKESLDKTSFADNALPYDLHQSQIAQSSHIPTGSVMAQTPLGASPTQISSDFNGIRENVFKLIGRPQLKLSDTIISTISVYLSEHSSLQTV